jgi:hypothetical protein
MKGISNPGSGSAGGLRSGSTIIETCQQFLSLLDDPPTTVHTEAISPLTACPPYAVLAPIEVFVPVVCSIGLVEVSEGVEIGNPPAWLVTCAWHRTVSLLESRDWRTQLVSIEKTCAPIA